MRDLFQPLESSAAIRGVSVSAVFPETGDLDAFIFGEAPGPRGADKTGIPFWGDGAGLPLYRALTRAGRAIVPEAAWDDWDGMRFNQQSLRPVLIRVALSNAFPRCPSDDGRRFRAPSRAELNSAQNVQRLGDELQKAKSRQVRCIITLGNSARHILSSLAGAADIPWVGLPHPSAQGLLSTAPNKGKGARMSDLAAAWEDRLASLLSGFNEGASVPGS